MSALTAKGRQSEAVAAKADRMINFLCSAPTRANTTVSTRVFRSMLLRSDGYANWEGKRYEIKGKSLGAGVYRVTLEEA